MKVFHGRMDGRPSEQRGPTFTGVVWADPVMGVGFDNFPFADGRGLAETGQTGKDQQRGK